MMKTAVLKITCLDRKGFIAGICDFIFANGGNIVSLGEYVDPEEKQLFMRIEWDLGGFGISKKELPGALKKLAAKTGFENGWELFYSDRLLRMAIFVSKYDHCLHDLMLRHRAGEIKCEIPLIISNHDDLKYVADYFGVDFICVPISKENKREAEKKELSILKKHRIDFIVLARYMQILSGEFIANYENKIINIHHSFLPAFEGAKPYHQACEKGVKIIGATSHFVNTDLDRGPIIQQGVAPVSHRDTVDDLVIKGRDIERMVLSNAVKLFIEHRVFICRNRTVIL